MLDRSRQDVVFLSKKLMCSNTTVYCNTAVLPETVVKNRTHGYGV